MRKINFEHITKELNLLNMPKDMMIEYYPTSYCFISEYVFNLSFYDDEVADLVGKKIYEIIMIITNNQNFDYIEDNNNYLNYLYIANLLDEYNIIDWGTSIRGAWIKYDIRIDLKLILEKIFDFYKPIKEGNNER